MRFIVVPGKENPGRYDWPFYLLDTDEKEDPRPLFTQIDAERAATAANRRHYGAFRYAALKAAESLANHVATE